MKAQPGARIEPHNPEPRTGDSQVMEWIAAGSPRARARITGVVYTALIGFHPADPIRGSINGVLSEKHVQLG